MLTRFDDFPIHQTPEPIAIPCSSDRDVYDRYWFNGYQDDGEFAFGLTLGLYPNLGIMDGAFSIARGGEQHSFFASRRAPLDPTELRIGPLVLRVLDPMRRLELVIDDNDTGIAAQITWTARTTALHEGRERRMRGKRYIIDSTRFVQFGNWDGEIRYAGESVRLERSRVFGARDRSWGSRDVDHPRDPAIAPEPVSERQTFSIWAPIHFRDRCIHYASFEDAAGEPWKRFAAIATTYERPEDFPDTEAAGEVEAAAGQHDIDWVPGTRRARAARFVLEDVGAGRRFEVELEPLCLFSLKGIGYFHTKWGNAVWQGELVTGSERWKLDEIDPLALDHQLFEQVVRARIDGEQGVGTFQQMSLGPHARYGFTDFLDGAS
jgi:hypothetical protein